MPPLQDLHEDAESAPVVSKYVPAAQGKHPEAAEPAL
jgi:hypothetical protein